MGGMTGHEDVADQIRALEDRRYQALMDGDLGALEELFSDDLVYTHSDAKTDSKASFLDKMATGYLKYGQVGHPESAIVVHGDCVLVFGDMTGDVQVGDQARVLNNKSLSVWVRDGERWVLLAYQPTKYPA
jgi:ketosteroid isomerase-like protein